MSATKYCNDPDNCTYSDCPTAFCDRDGQHSLAPSPCCAARFECLKLSAKLDSRAEKCSEQQHQNGEYGNLRHDAEVMRMASKILAREAQHNDRTEAQPPDAAPRNQK